MNGEVKDTRLLTFLQRQIGNHGLEKELPNFYFCGSRILEQPCSTKSVYLVANDEKSKFIGVQTCRNSWGCPRCTAKVMATFGTNIACAIDALAKWKNEYAIMVTFTLPHTSNMSCAETFFTLKDAWRMLMKAGNFRQRSGNDRKNGKPRGDDVWGAFRENLHIKHFVRVYEFTYGKNSWHPHIHALFWIPKKLFNQCVDYEPKLVERWWHCCKYSYKKYLDSKFPNDKIENTFNVEALFNEARKTHPSLYISKDELGRPIPQKSSTYISGWNANFELTNLHVKEAHTHHYTPFQLIDKAHEYRNNDEKREKFLSLFFEYLLTVRGQKRVHFSARSGIKDIIKAWKATEHYIETFKKKFMEKETEKWNVVVWFKSEDWLKLCWIELTTNNSLKAKLLKLATKPNAKELIDKLLEEYDIKCQGRNDNFDIFVKREILCIEKGMNSVESALQRAVA